jgi:CAAX protease family protein
MGARPAASARGVRRELIASWASVIGLLAVARLASGLDPTRFLSGNLAAVAAVLFIAVPERVLRRRGETWEAHGLSWWGAGDRRTWAAWAAGAGWGLAICAVVLPLFALAFLGYLELVPRLAAGPLRLLGPYATAPHFAFRLPQGFLFLIASQLVVVAVPEEMFYRGFLQTSWARVDPSRQVRVFGAELGSGFVATQVLFALGHLVSLQPWRIATFFPGLLFGWTRARTGGLAAPVVVHAVCNVFLATLEASLLGHR